MTVTEIKQDNGITLKIVGSVDTVSAPDLQKEILKEFQKTDNLFLDFEGVTYISSAGLRSLLLGQKTAMSKHGSMVLQHVNESVMNVFNLTKFSTMLQIEE